MGEWNLFFGWTMYKCHLRELYFVKINPQDFLKTLWLITKGTLLSNWVNDWHYIDPMLLDDLLNGLLKDIKNLSILLTLCDVIRVNEQNEHVHLM
jgi:hypothetical protein